MSKLNIDAAQLDFIDRCAELLVPRGMPRSVARLFSYLMLCPHPVSLDDICRDLQVAKSSASVAARLLETAKLVRRHGQPGSKRVLYSLPDKPGALLAEQSQSLGQMGELLQQSAPAVAEGAAAERMLAIAEFYLTMEQVINTAIADLTAAQPDASRLKLKTRK